MLLNIISGSKIRINWHLNALQNWYEIELHSHFLLITSP